jgi:hypothetical protein
MPGPGQAHRETWEVVQGCWRKFCVAGQRGWQY